MSRFIPFLAIIFVLATIFLYIRPTLTGPVADTRQEIQSYDSALAAAERFQQKEAELTQERDRIPADSLARLNAFLPDGVDNVQLILDLDALAARSGMTLSDFDIAAGTGDTTSSSASSTDDSGSPSLESDSGSPIDSIDLTFKAKGSYSSYRAFLDGIENSLRPLDVVALDLTQSETGVYDYAMTVRLYWLR